MLKMTLIATAAVVGLSLTAWAGEGNGDPFPGPDAAVTTSVQTPHYTMGGDAPFNYFTTSQPTPLAGYHQAESQSDNPYPFSMPGQVIRMQPASPTSLASHQGPGGHS